jgi:hypothetical protein
MYSKTITFLIKASSRSAIRRKYGSGLGCFYLLFKTRLLTLLSSVSHSPSHRQAGDSVINIHSTLRIASDMCKNVSLAVLFGSNGNSYTACTLSYMCIYRRSSHCRDAGGRAKERKKLDRSEHRVPRKSVLVPFWAHVP